MKSLNWGLAWVYIAMAGIFLGVIGVVIEATPNVPLNNTGWMFLGILYTSLFHLLMLLYLIHLESTIE